MVPAARDEEIKTLVVQQSESDTVSTQGNSRKYASAITLLALVAVAGISMHRHFVQSNGTDAEIGDIIEACADYTVQASCSAASCLWNSASVQCEEAAQRAIDNRPYVVAAEREAATTDDKLITITPNTITLGTPTVTLKGSANTDKWQWSLPGAGCNGNPTSNTISGTNVAVPPPTTLGTHQLCYKKGSDDVSAQVFAILTVTAATSAAKISGIVPASITAGVASSVELKGSTVGDKYDWSAQGAPDCTGVLTPSQTINKADETVTVTQAAVGTYKLCYQTKGSVDSVAQTDGDLTVLAATSATKISAIVPASITAGVASSVELTGSAVGDKYDWSAQGASDCTLVTTPSQTINTPDETVTVRKASAGTYKLCYQTKGSIDSVAQDKVGLIVTAATPASPNTQKPDGTIAMELCAAITTSPTTQITLCDRTYVAVGMTLTIGTESVKITGIVGRRLSGEGRQLATIPVVVSVAPPVIGLFNTKTGVLAKLPVTAAPAAATPSTAAPAPATRVTPCTGSVMPACNNVTAATGTPDLGEQFSCATQGKPETQMMSICQIFQAHCLQPFDAAWLTNRPRCKGMIPRHDGSLDHVVTGAKVGRWN